VSLAEIVTRLTEYQPRTEKEREFVTELLDLVELTERMSA